MRAVRLRPVYRWELWASRRSGQISRRGERGDGERREGKAWRAVSRVRVVGETRMRDGAEEEEGRVMSLAAALPVGVRDGSVDG